MRLMSFALLASLAALLAAQPGCIRADVQVPDRFDFNSGKQPPPRQIPEAVPTDLADLQREVIQLRAQNADLRTRLSDLTCKLGDAKDRIDDLEEKNEDLREKLKD